MLNFRVTQNVYLSQALTNSQLHSRNLATLQQQASTGLRLERPSDDPIAMRNVLANKARVKRLDTDLANLRDAQSRLDSSVTNLLDANNIAVRAKQIALDGVQSISEEHRNTLSQEVDALLDRLVQIANSDFGGQYLYGGQADSAKPFTLGANQSVQYNGSTERGGVELSSGAVIDSLYTGREVFQHASRGAAVVTGKTGAAPGTAASSGVGRLPLTVSHTSTSYAPGSGVQPGSKSADGDTVIGPPGAHTLTITDTSGTGASGTVSLNGGPAVNFTSADGNLLVTGPKGERAYINTTNISAGFSGTVDITSDGTLSLDGGATTLAIDFSSNQQVIDSASGQVANIDSRSIRQAGEATVEFTGTSDLFATLAQLRDDLRGGGNLDSTQFTEALSRRIADLDRHSDNLMTIVGDQSATLESLQAIDERTQDLQLSLASVISDNESADIVEVALNLQNSQNMLQYTFAVTARMFDLNLLNFLG